MTTEAAVVETPKRKRAPLSEARQELEERCNNAASHLAAAEDAAEQQMVATLDRAESVWKFGTELAHIRAKGLAEHDPKWSAGDGWEGWVAARFKQSASWCALAIRFSREVKLDVVRSKKLAIIEWQQLLIGTSHVPPGRRGAVIEEAAAAVHDAHRNGASEHDGRKGRRAKPEIARVAAEQAAEKAGAPKRKVRRPREDDDAVDAKAVTLIDLPAIERVPESGKLLLERPETGQACQRTPKTPRDLQFRFFLGRKQVVFTIRDRYVEYLIQAKGK